MMYIGYISLVLKKEELYANYIFIKNLTNEHLANIKMFFSLNF